MRKILLLLLLLSTFSCISFSQAPPFGSVKGSIADSATLLPLHDATISIVRLKDSSVVAHSLSRQDGTFVVDKIPFGRYVMQLSFQGFATKEKTFEVSPQHPLVNTGTVLLTAEAKDLGVVVVKA